MPDLIPKAPALGTPELLVQGPELAPGNKSSNRPNSWPRRIAIGLGPWWLFCLVTSIYHFFLGQEYFRAPASLPAILLYNIPLWSLWWPVNLLVAWLCRHWRLTAQRWLMPLAIHWLAGFAVVAGFILIASAWSLVAFPHPLRPDTGWWDAVVFFTGNVSAIVNLLIFWVLVIGHHALGLRDELRDRELQQALLQAELSRSQLRALKMQLQPHFLFNSLNSAVSLVLQHKNEQAGHLLQHLSQFLRMTLEDTGEQEIPLRRELAFAEQYLKIEQFRFPGSWRYRTEVSAEVLEARVPNLLLQPLLENAARHAVGPAAGDQGEDRGLLQVFAHRVGSRLQLILRDDGLGEQAQIPGSGLGLGLENVQNRLQHLYGSDHRFVTRSHPDGGFEVTIELPFRPGRESEESV